MIVFITHLSLNILVVMSAHVIMECPGVAEYRTRYLESLRSLPEIVGNLKGLEALGKLGWLE